MLLIQLLLHELITHFVRELGEEERSYLESEAKSLFHMAKGEQEGQHQVEVVEAAEESHHFLEFPRAYMGS